jgi:NAD kinase
MKQEVQGAAMHVRRKPMPDITSCLFIASLTLDSFTIHFTIRITLSIYTLVTNRNNIVLVCDHNNFNNFNNFGRILWTYITYFVPLSMF